MERTGSEIGRSSAVGARVAAENKGFNSTKNAFMGGKGGKTSQRLQSWSHFFSVSEATERKWVLAPGEKKTGGISVKSRLLAGEMDQALRNKYSASNENHKDRGGRGDVPQGKKQARAKKTEG